MERPSAPPCTPELPPELWQLVFANLAPSDQKTARMVCSSFAKLAFGHLFSAIAVCYSSEDFTGLRNLTQDRRLAHCVKSFRFNPCFLPDPESDIRHRYRQIQIATSKDSGSLQHAELDKACAAPARPRALNDCLDIETMVAIFKPLRHLTSLTISFLPEDNRAAVRNFWQLVFDDDRIGRDRRTRDWTLWRYARSTERGTISRNMLACAAANLRQPLRKLQLLGVDLVDFYAYVHCGDCGALGPLLALLQGLHELHIQLAFDKQLTMGSVSIAYVDSFRDFLRIASSACEILRMDFGDGSERYNHTLRSCKTSFYDVSWPKLKHLRIGDPLLTAHLTVFLQKLPSLETLELDMLRVTGGSKFFKSAAGTLRRLRLVKLNGPAVENYLHDRRDLVVDDAPGLQELKDELIACLVLGGVPPDRDHMRKRLDAIRRANMPREPFFFGDEQDYRPQRRERRACEWHPLWPFVQF